MDSYVKEAMTLNKNRDWTVLLIGGASGTGKSSLAYALSRFYEVNVMEVDDVTQAIKATTTKEILPAVHHWSSGVNWLEVGVSGNVKWLIDVSKEMIPALKVIVNRHIADNVPIIIEGDFIYPEFVMSFDSSEVKSFFVLEQDKEQILQNFYAREGGEFQHFRADISASYGEWISETCQKLEVPLIESRPWNTLLYRAVECLYPNERGMKNEHYTN